MNKPMCTVGLSFCLLTAQVVAQTPPGQPTQAQVVKKINLNNANAETLAQAMKGIGVKRAEAIVKHRQEQGAFKSLTELGDVKGLGKVFVTKHLTQLEAVFSLE